MPFLTSPRCESYRLSELSRLSRGSCQLPHAWQQSQPLCVLSSPTTAKLPLPVMMTSGALVGPDSGADGGVGDGDPFTGGDGVGDGDPFTGGDELAGDGDSVGVQTSSCWRVAQSCQALLAAAAMFLNIVPVADTRQVWPRQAQAHCFASTCRQCSTLPFSHCMSGKKLVHGLWATTSRHQPLQLQPHMRGVKLMASTGCSSWPQWCRC